MNALAIVPAERLTSHAQLFRCAPYSANITARTCLARQTAVSDSRTGKAPPKYPRCVGCDLGAQVAARVEGDDAGASVGVVCAHPSGCTVVLTSLPRGRKVRPLCPAHRPQKHAATPPRELAPEVCADIDDDPREELPEAPASPAPKESPVKLAKKTKLVKKLLTTAEATAPATCGVLGCGAPQGRVRTDSVPETADFCARDRLTARNRARDAGVTLGELAEMMRAGTWKSAHNGPKPRAAKPAKKPARKATVKRPTKPVAVSPLADVLVYLERCAALVERLGGLDAAEAFVERLATMRAP